MGFGDWITHGAGSELWDPRKALNRLGITHPDPPDLSKGADAQAIRDYAAQLTKERGEWQPGAVTGAPTYDQQKAMGLQENAALGTAPSAAANLMQQGIDQGIGAQMGMASAMQGSNPGASLRAGLTGAANVINQTSAAAAAQRAAEMAQARGDYAGSATAIAGQGINAGLNQQQINNQYRLGQTQELGDVIKAPYQTAVQAQAAQLQNSAANQAGIGGLLGGVGKMLSDERVKKNIESNGPAADAFLEGLKPKTFDYKDPSAPGQYPGHQLGVIAQDMLGGTQTGPDGKKWISADVIGRVLAGMGRLNERLDGVEGKRG